MFEQVLQSDLVTLIKNFGDLGVFIAMFLESSVVPIPSEVIITSAGAINIPIHSIVIFGSIGATLGASVGYALGRYTAMPVILKFGRFIFIKPHHIYKAEAFAKKYGVASVLIGRLVPIVPFKVFSIASGITEIPFIPFILCTMVGVLPRMYILAIFGVSIIKYTKPVLLITALALAAFLVFKLTRKTKNNQ
jgi:membrane protein DedA with SNARE-associated domain